MQRRTAALAVGIGLILAIGATLWVAWPRGSQGALIEPEDAPAAVEDQASGAPDAPKAPSEVRDGVRTPGATSSTAGRTDARPALTANNDGRESIAQGRTASGAKLEDAGAPMSPTDDPGANRARAQQRFVERRQWRWEDRISEQVAELSAEQRLTQAQQDELFTIMTAASGALRDALREATRSGTPQAGAVQRALDETYTQADVEARRLLTDAQYQAYQAMRARGGLMGPNPSMPPPQQPVP